MTAPYEGDPSDDCLSDCAYINEPPGGSCPDKDPFECNGEAPGGSDETGGEEAGTDGGDEAG
ncbi:hypothetical protein G6O69_07030 [Pseudenhygromyxa sp. WMMC2535]|uniref:hypothetical protein n=1 Tax=Pseudenhygromyxa sp. WMMC2535 TaxID=2712867 RepID=UPI001551DDBD|nr:hypothetical protein [Pseudenhygromyxa sp. WMMC2535]NVB37580.1 hypothetical protein [Pseudenhygromyxa sp. WMMC2535]